MKLLIFFIVKVLISTSILGLAQPPPDNSPIKDDLVTVVNMCGENRGSLIVHEENLPPGTEYFWLDTGAPGSRFNLSDGIYTLVLINDDECIEKRTYEIKELLECEVIFIEEQLTQCWSELFVYVKSGNEYLDPNSYTIHWGDGSSGQSVYLFKGVFTRICITIEVFSEGDCCNGLEECFDSYPDSEGCVPKPKDEEPKVIVNEKGGSNKTQTPDSYTPFVELLVVGHGDCEGYTDLRGFIIDDNNGELIVAPSEFDTSNFHLIGLDPGFLRFKNIEEWAQIPNGSLIVVFDGENNEEQFIEDPLDEDGNFVYFIDANNSEFFVGQTGDWNDSLNQMEYLGSEIEPSWDLVYVNDSIDGFQTRNPDGTLNHGISRGFSGLGVNETYYLFLGSHNSGDNCSFFENDYTEPGDFFCGELLNTPGLPNSLDNLNYIRALRNCDHQPLSIPEIEELQQQFNEGFVDEIYINNEYTLAAYPNPFQKKFTVEYKGLVDGNYTINVYDFTGRMIKTVDWEGATTGTKMLNLSNIPAGMLIIELIFPDKMVLQSTLVHIK